MFAELSDARPHLSADRKMFLGQPEIAPVLGPLDNLKNVVGAITSRAMSPSQETLLKLSESAPEFGHLKNVPGVIGRKSGARYTRLEDCSPSNARV